MRGQQAYVEHKLSVPVGFQEGNPGGNWMKTIDANIFKVFSLVPSVCLKGNTILSHCAGLAQMAGEIWQQDYIRGLALSLFSPPGFLSLAITFFCCTWCSSIRSFLYFSKNWIHCHFCHYKKKGNWTWEGNGCNITIQSKRLFVVIGTDLRLLHKENVIWDLLHLTQS